MNWSALSESEKLEYLHKRIENKDQQIGALQISLNQLVEKVKKLETK
jgi:hypothetical protein